MEEGGPPELISGDEAQPDANSQKNFYWDVAKKITLMNTMGWLSAGFGVRNDDLKAVGIGALSVLCGEKSAEVWPKDRVAGVINLVDATGAAIWTAGIAARNPYAKAAGPALCAAVNLVSAGVQYYRGDKNWSRKLVDVANRTAFSISEYTGSPPVRMMAFASETVGHFWDARQDKGMIPHGFGTSAWALGAVRKSDTVESVGAGFVAFAETGRLAYAVKKRWAETSSAEAAPKQSGSEPAPVPGGDSTVGPAPEVSLRLPANPVAEALHSAVPTASRPKNSQVSVSVAAVPAPGAETPVPVAAEAFTPAAPMVSRAEKPLVPRPEKSAVSRPGTVVSGPVAAVPVPAAGTSVPMAPEVFDPAVSAVSGAVAIAAPRQYAASAPARMQPDSAQGERSGIPSRPSTRPASTPVPVKAVRTRRA
ncbi:hypothetical protein GCM10009863_10820 [Streptomyces axinellae]|uniref:Uncharacterized protein n=2 Tax=Streptomyces axinellae TaxID=552788 RepID=A0ABN3PUE1_9ACTN